MPALRNLVARAAERLSLGPHPDRARQDAETLLLHILGKNKAWLLSHLDEELPEDQAARYMQLLERRYRGEPIQYITGETEFYGLPFRVTPDVLIPRPETEHLVEIVLAWAASLAARETPPRIPRLRILDIGAGSGAIAVALAHKLPHAAVTAIDFSPSALDLARHNAALNRVSSRIRFLEGDLLAPVANQQFEIIVSNPPYVPVSDRASLSVEVRDHEPALALFAGPDGLDVCRRLIPQAFACLVPGGFVALEFGYGQHQVVAALLASANFYPIDLIPDLQGIPRVASAWRR